VAHGVITVTRLLRFFLLAALALRSASAQVEVPAGTPLSIRLNSRLSSKHSQAGEPVSATLIAPISVQGKVLIPAGYAVQGTVINPTPAHKRLDHSVLCLSFGELTGAGNRSVLFQAHVQSVDNGRETVDSQGIIHGLRPLRRRPTEIEDILMLAAAAHPAVLASLELGRFVVAEEEKPRITYEPGVELWLTLTAPLQAANFPKPETSRVPAAVLPSKELRALVDGFPLRTSNSRGTPSDLTNLLLFGSQEAVVNAFRQAGWMEAASLDLKTEAETFLAVAGHHSYREGPVSSLFIDGEKPALVFEKATNTFAKRHHVRIWREPQTFQGMPVWIGAGTHDTGIDFSREAKTFSHSVDGEIDLERQKIENDLLFTGLVAAAGLMDRPAAPHAFQNATGDQLRTDGKIALLRLKF
jgi:LssY C-terminus